MSDPVSLANQNESGHARCQGCRSVDDAACEAGSYDGIL